MLTGDVICRPAPVCSSTRIGLRTYRTQRTFPRETDMSNMPAGASQSVAVTALGLLTLLLGGGYVVMGGTLVWGGAAMANDPAGGWGPLLQVFAGLIAALGVPFLLQ